jgi:hypothetical protein
MASIGSANRTRLNPIVPRGMLARLARRHAPQDATRLERLAAMLICFYAHHR